MTGDTVQPGHHVEAIVDRICDAQQPQEGLLEDVVGLDRVAQVADGERAQAVVVPCEEALEAAHVAPAVGLEQPDVVVAEQRAAGGRHQCDRRRRVT